MVELCSLCYIGIEKNHGIPFIRTKRFVRETCGYGGLCGSLSGYAVLHRSRRMDLRKKHKVGNKEGSENRTKLVHCNHSLL